MGAFKKLNTLINLYAEKDAYSGSLRSVGGWVIYNLTIHPT